MAQQVPIPAGSNASAPTLHPLPAIVLSADDGARVEQLLAMLPQQVLQGQPPQPAAAPTPVQPPGADLHATTQVEPPTLITTAAMFSLLAVSRGM